MNVLKESLNLLKNMAHEIKCRLKLKQMDDWWYYTGGNGYELFLPSFYYTHTDEEINRITNETLNRIHTMLVE